MLVEATASSKVNNSNRSLKALLAAGTAGAAMMGIGLMGTTAHADTLVDANHVQVDAGDTLSVIAQKHNTTVDQLAKDNNISDVNLIHVGDRLVIASDGQTDNSVDTNSVNTETQTANATYTAPSQSTPSVSSDQYASQENTGTATAASNNGGGNYSSNLGGSEQAAKDWIAQRESGGNYGATNGQYIGKYQLSSAYLNGDYSPSNQERVADQYCQQRYGSWQAAKAHWEQNGWW